MTNISIIGPGRVGGALAIALSGCGYRIDSIASRRKGPASEIIGKIGENTRIVDSERLHELRGEIVLITTRDDQIGRVAEALSSGSPPPGTIVLHTSGSKTSEVLSPLRSAGARIGSIHPLVSISDPSLGATRFAGAYFCVEGDPEAVAAAVHIVEDLGGRHFEIPTDKKPLYHAAAVMACGHLVALISESVEMLAKCGPDEEESKRILLPLIGSTLQNLHDQTFTAALTGPFARSDVETFRSHLEAFDGEVSEDLVSAYLLLGLRSLRLALRDADDPSDTDRFIELVLEMLRNRSL